MRRFTLQNVWWIVAGGRVRHLAGRFDIVRILPLVHQSQHEGLISPRVRCEIEASMWARAGDPKMAAIFRDEGH